MADTEDPAEAAARLEAALERIALLAAPPAPVDGTDAPDSGTPAMDMPRIAARLDALIAQIRAALAASASS